MMVGQLLMLALFAAHAGFDCLCTLCTLFAREGGRGERLRGFYARALLGDEAHREDPVTVRAVAYYVAAMSLARAVAVCAPGGATCACVAAMYALQALAAEYEGFTARAACQVYARLTTTGAAFMALFSALLACTFL